MLVRPSEGSASFIAMQKVHATNHSFERSVKALHDHLYANSHLREPEALHAEVAKVLSILTAAARKAPGNPKNGSTGERSPRVSLPDEVRAAYAAAHDDEIELDDAGIESVSTYLGKIDLASAERDFVGDALETMRSTAAKRLGGQFFTDQRVTHLAVALLDYSPSEHDFVDVCAGTGGFLIAAAAVARRTHGAHKTIVGTEVDPKIASLAQRALTQLDSGTIRVARQDSLRPLATWGDLASSSISQGSHLRLASNPPFGLKITVKDAAALAEFELAKTWSKRAGSWEPGTRTVPRPPDILFIERNLELAAPGKGQVALVMPYQVLSGPRLGFVREWLLRHARVLAVVDLPEHTFQPWTGTKTSLLVFERRAVPLERWDERDEGPIFMAVTKHIGHDRRGNPVFDDQGEILTDLPQVAAAWRAFRDGLAPTREHPDAFEISSARIGDGNDLRLNAAYHHPRATRLRHAAATVSDAFSVVRLGDVVDAIWCPGRFKRRFTDDAITGIPFLGGANISQFSVTTNKYLRPDDPRIAELTVEPGLILVTRSGSTGIVSRVPAAWGGWAISDHVIRIRANDERLSGDYIEAFLRSSYGQELLAAGVFGSVIDEITPEYIADLLIPVPKPGALLERIISGQRAANDAREAITSGLDDSSSALDEALGGHLRS
jgi:type I restriction enzyme M protein